MVGIYHGWGLTVWSDGRFQYNHSHGTPEYNSDVTRPLSQWQTKKPIVFTKVPCVWFVRSETYKGL